MSWWSKPHCPVDADSKKWIEQRFGWLTNEFGIERLRSHETVIPTAEYLPLEFLCTEDGIGDLMSRVAGFMDFDPELLRVNFYQDDNPKYEGTINSGTAGLHSETNGKFDIWLEAAVLNDPVAVIGTLAHEISRVLLLGQQRVTADEGDHEPLADLLSVYLGVGIFPANCVVHESHWREGHWSGWSISRRGYLSMDMYGYALALYSLARYTPRPNWASYLRLDVRGALTRGIRYITHTQDCEYVPAIQGTGS